MLINNYEFRRDTIHQWEAGALQAGGAKQGRGDSGNP